MQIRILFFGVLKDLAGKASDELDFPAGATVRDVLAHYQARIPRLAASLPSLAIAVNQEYANPEATLTSGVEVALLPPVSGGSQSVVRPCASIIRDPIDTQHALAAIKRPEDGAAVVFEGVVRNQTRGRK